MDPLTQGLVGAMLPMGTLRRKKTVHANRTLSDRRKMLLCGLFGLVGGMAPDLDSFIRSDADPLLYLEYHRQFSHSLLFIPLGGVLCATVLHLILGRWLGLPFLTGVLYCTLGYATHGLLDAATSYGTMLLWPFSDARIAWSIISIIDPIFTLPLLLLVVLSLALGSGWFARLAWVWAALYLGFGLTQHWAATDEGQDLAAKRGHTQFVIDAKPSFGNQLVWKTLYRQGDAYYVDAVRVLPFTDPKVYPGTSIAALDLTRDLPWLDADSQQAEDIERFRWFSRGYLALSKTDPNRIIDLRYSMLPNAVDGLWFIELTPNAPPETHVVFDAERTVTPEDRETLMRMIKGEPLIED
ncbi:MAG: metal-dependent hydrolase [Rhodospirillaceae bacterium]